MWHPHNSALNFELPRNADNGTKNNDTYPTTLTIALPVDCARHFALGWWTYF